MPRGYRSIILAAVGCLILGNAAQNKDQQGHNGDTKSSAQQRPPATAIVIPPIRPADPKADQSECVGEDNERQDCTAASAQAAIDQASYARWQTIVGAIGAGIGFATLIAAFLAAKWAKNAAVETKRSADISEGAVATEHRAWLSMKKNDKMAFNPLQMQGGAGFISEFSVTIENHGGSVGKETFFAAKIILLTQEIDIRAELEVFCRRWDIDRGAMGQTVFPGQEYTMGHMVSIFQEDIDRSFLPGSKWISPYILAVLTYQSRHVSGRRHTAFAWPLNRIQNGDTFVVDTERPEWWRDDIRPAQAMYSDIT